MFPGLDVVTFKPLVHTVCELRPVSVQATHPARGVPTEQPSPRVPGQTHTLLHTGLALTWEVHVQIMHQMSPKRGPARLLNM